MKKVFVFCIGGTGIRVMKSITMLMASGMNTNGYTVVPIILDPHLDLEEKKNLNALIDSYKTVYDRSVTDGSQTLNTPNGFFGTRMMRLNEVNNDQNNTNEVIGSKETFRSYIHLSDLGIDNINNLLVETLFSTKNLNSQLSVGFKGNPNMGTVVLGDMIEGADWFKGFKTHCEKDDRIFIISSIFGGTGASGFPLLEKKIKGDNNYPALQNALMGAVTVLPYYGLKDPTSTGSDIDSANFYTKTKAALAYYEKTILSDYLYYIGEQSLCKTYENDEKKQEDTANFIELVAASALFDFLTKEKPSSQQFLTRAMDEDANSLTLDSMGNGYTSIVKSVADYMVLCSLIKVLPKEKYFPLKITRAFDDTFYKDAAFLALTTFTDIYEKWYQELANNTRAFSPLNTDSLKQMSRWIKGRELDAANDSYYLLQMIKESNADRTKEHKNKFRFFLDFAYKAINHYTHKIEQ